MNIKHFLATCQTRVNCELERRLPQAVTKPQRLHEAMRYSVFIGGKRIRPAFVYATGIALNIAESLLDSAACAVELIHTFSLVHDDLPAMDDDALRRGRPTCHKAFDDATAILAGDALQSLAFECLVTVKSALSANQRLAMIEILGYASGSLGMAGGQLLDLAAVDQAKLTIKDVETIHRLKTGALLSACVELALSATNCQDARLQTALREYAECIGLGFQIQDDLLDVLGATETLGKPQGADSRQGKSTYATLLPLPEAQQKVQDLHDKAIKALAPLGQNALALQAFAEYLLHRRH